MTGTVTRVFLPRGFAFIRGEDGLDYFFQAKELAIGQWDGLVIHEGTYVSFEPTNDGPKGNGLRATQVQVC